MERLTKPAGPMMAGPVLDTPAGLATAIEAHPAAKKLGKSKTTWMSMLGIAGSIAALLMTWIGPAIPGPWLPAAGFVLTLILFGALLYLRRSNAELADLLVTIWGAMEQQQANSAKPAQTTIKEGAK